MIDVDDGAPNAFIDGVRALAKRLAIPLIRGVQLFEQKVRHPVLAPSAWR